MFRKPTWCLSPLIIVVSPAQPYNEYIVLDVLLLRSASLALSTEFNMLQHQVSWIWAAAFYPIPTRAEKRYNGAAGPFAYMFVKFVFAAEWELAVTLNNRRSMRLRGLKMPLKVFLEAEIHVTLWTVVPPALIVGWISIIHMSACIREMFGVWTRGRLVV